MARSHERGARSEEQGSLSTVMAILLQCWRSTALSNTNNPLDLFAWWFVNQTAKKIVKMAALLAPLNLRRHSIALD